MMDKHKLIRLFLFSSSLLVYFYFFKPKIEPEKGKIDYQENQPSQHSDSLNDTPFAHLTAGVAREVVVENELFCVKLNSKGGGIQEVTLKKYKDRYGNPLVLLDADKSKMGLSFPYKNLVVRLNELYFQTQANGCYQLKGNQQAQFIFRLEVNSRQYIEQTFEFLSNSYQVNSSWKAVGMEEYMGKQSNAAFSWEMTMNELEGDTKSDLSKSTVNYYLANNAFDSLKETSKELEKKKLHTPVKWVNVKQRFFSSAIIATTSFTSGRISLQPTFSDEGQTKTAKLFLRLSKEEKVKGSGSYTFFFGPNDYNILKTVTKGFQQNLPLGWAIIRFINQGIIIPLFTFLEGYFTNYGIIIFLLILVIKLLLAPLSYKSFISMAKLRLLKPELDKIKSKHGNDLPKIQSEQIMLYRELNINPLSSFVPIILQLPILLAIFNFLPNAISLRQASFLWAKDLSTYDSVFQLPFTIPMYGSHVSLFTILMVLSIMLYTWSSGRGNDTERSMKWISYIMPVGFMFILNGLPAGLSFYYFVSNVLSCLQQFLSKSLIHEESIKATITSKRQRGRQGSTASFQKRVAAAIDRQQQPDTKQDQE